MADARPAPALQHMECPVGFPPAQRTVVCSPLLALSPLGLEHEFWAQRMLLVIDVFAVVHALVMNMMLLKTFKVFSADHMMPHERAAILLYPFLALWHIGYMAIKPQRYQQHRLCIMLFNRVGRLLLLGATALLSTPEAAHKMAVALPGWQHFVHNATHLQDTAAAASDADAASMLGRMVTAGSAVPGVTGGSVGVSLHHHHQLLSDSWGQLLKPVCGPVMIALGYSQFVVPLWMNVPLQLATLVLALLIARVRLCWFLTRAGMQQLVMAGCNAVEGVVYAAGIFFGWPWTEVPPAHKICNNPVLAGLVITLYAHTVLLVVAPLVVQYAVELALKRQFVRGKGMQLLQTSSDSLLVTVVVGCTGLVAAWLLCSAVVSATPLLTCDKQGWVVRVPPVP